MRVVDQRLVCPLAASHADDEEPLGQASLDEIAVERGDQFAARKIARHAEYGNYSGLVCHHRSCSPDRWRVF